MYIYISLSLSLCLSLSLSLSVLLLAPSVIEHLILKHSLSARFSSNMSWQWVLAYVPNPVADGDAVLQQQALLAYQAMAAGMVPEMGVMGAEGPNDSTTMTPTPPVPQQGTAPTSAFPKTGMGPILLHFSRWTKAWLLP